MSDFRSLNRNAFHSDLYIGYRQSLYQNFRYGTAYNLYICHSIIQNQQQFFFQATFSSTFSIEQMEPSIESTSTNSSLAQINSQSEQQKEGQNEQKSAKIHLHDFQVIENIAPYLTTKELLKTSTLSKEYNFSLKKYIKKYILEGEDATALLNNNNLNTQTVNNELSMVRKLFERQIKICDLNSSSEQESVIPNQLIKCIQASGALTSNQQSQQLILIETVKGERILASVTQFQLNHKKLTAENQYVLPKQMQNAKFVLLIGDYLYVCQENVLRQFKVVIEDEGEHLVPRFDQKQAQPENEIKFDDGNIVFARNSATNLLIVTRNGLEEDTLWTVYLKHFKPMKISGVFDEKSEEKLIQNPSRSLSIGSDNCYYIDQSSSQVYELSLTQEKAKRSPLKTLNKKPIYRIANGAKHFYAVEKTHKLTYEWTTNELCEWCENEGFGDFVQIFKSEKVTGKSLLEGVKDKKYLEDVIGMLNHKQQQKLTLALESANKENEDNCNIFCWGRNDKSQLGYNPSNQINTLMKAKFPEGFKLLTCENNLTLIHNPKTGEICCNSILEGGNEKEGGANLNNGKFEWKSIFKRCFNIWSISVWKSRVFVLCSIEKEHKAQNMSEDPLHFKKDKLRTAKNIINKIQWDDNLDASEFKVGYFDKYDGILEVSFEELLKTPDIKEYRIEYFKRKGEVVWGKKDRIDIL